MVFNMLMIYYQNIYNEIHVDQMTQVMGLIGLLLASNCVHLHIIIRLYTFTYISVVTKSRCVLGEVTGHMLLA